MHIIYNLDKLNKIELMQGDLLERTPSINALLREVHPHFHASSKNLYFMVLTQSCDLVLRDGNSCKAPYISLAPVRSLDWLIKKHISGLSSQMIQAVLPVAPNKNKVKTREFLQRLFNNNELGYFFFDSERTPLTEDCVAVLNLSIAIKARLHYGKCLEAKILQLNDTFQAKLGWLVGQQYSRVGTPDWPLDRVNSKIKNLLPDMAIWVDDKKIKEIEQAYQLAQLYSNCHGASRGRTIDAAEISRAVSVLPSQKQTILDEVERVIKTVADPEMAEKIKRKLISDAGLNSLLTDNSLLKE